MFNNILKFCGKSDNSNSVSMNNSSGDIVLGYGQHEISITMDKTPCKVSLNISSPCDSATICQGDINKIGVTILETGFVLYADIKTNTCCVEWACDVTKKKRG